MTRPKGSKNFSTLKRNAYAIAKKEAKGRFQARAEEDRKHPERVLRRWLAPALENLDLMESVAVLGATVLIKQGIDWSQTVIPQAVAKSQALLQGVFGYGQLLEMLIRWIQGTEGGEVPEEKPPGIPQAEALEWLTSFTLAYVIVHNFSAIATLGNNVLGIAKMLLATA